MKNIIIKFIITLFTSFIISDLNAQNLSFSSESVMQPYQLEITCHKTTLLIFPAAVKSGDRGDAYVLAEKVKGAENILKVKAGQADFAPSNLNVITADGKVYTFNVSYAAEPSLLTIDLSKQQANTPVQFEGVSLNDKELEFYSWITATINPYLKKGRFSKYGIEFYLRGVHIKNNVLFFSYKLKNQTKLSFNESSIRFYVSDKKSAKRTAMQQNEVRPLYLLRKGLPENEDGQTLVIAFPKFSIAESKFFTVELMEQNGDRNPTSKLDQRVLLRAKWF
jgi:conjugative transposon TraN protein